jgi:ethanolamine utilization microcompartment shell protein EutL
MLFYVLLATRGAPMPTKLSVSRGPLLINFEGEEAFLVEHILPLFLTALGEGGTDGSANETVTGSAAKRQPMSMTTRSIASKLGADSGTTLAYAAAAALSLMQGQEQFSRQNLHDAMKSATGFYKQTYGSNLSNYIDTLTKQGTLIEISKDMFTVKSSELDAMRSKLEV